VERNYDSSDYMLSQFSQYKMKYKLKDLVRYLNEQFNPWYRLSKELEIDLKECEDEVTVKEDDILDKEEEIQQLTIDLQEMVEKVHEKEMEGELEAFWNNKYPKAIITYGGRYLPFSDKKIQVPVSVLITPTDPIILEDLKEWGFLDSNESWETLIPKIYLKIKRKYYEYEFDRKVWGKDEVWEFPFEMREKGFKKGYDCDSWMIFQLSYYIGCGCPEWRLRGVGGNTRRIGHATVYVYSLETREWHHLNSTYGSMFTGISLSQYPTHDDAGKADDMGIVRVWFSFNNKYAWMKIGGKTNDKNLSINR